MSIATFAMKSRITEENLHGIIAQYIEQESSSDLDLENRMKELLASDPLFRLEAQNAVHEAIVLSTLVVATENDSDFSEIISEITSINDDFIKKMRSDIFIDSVEVITESTIETADDIEIINKRSLVVSGALQS